MEYKRLSRCGIDNCKQTQFYIENGRWFCKNGHMREGEVEMEADNDGFGQTGARAARSQDETGAGGGSSGSGGGGGGGGKVLRGRKGFELYLQCLQILLQKQVWWLVKHKGFPAELEAIVRDLWALRLQILAPNLPGNLPPPPPPPSSQAGQGRAGGGYHSDSDAGNRTQPSYLYSSDSDAASTTRSGRKRRQRRIPGAADRPKLIESLALCYLGLVLLRCAVSLADVQRWAETQGLVYLRAIRDVPEAMKEKLSAEYWTAMDPSFGLRRSRLHRTVHRMVAAMHEHFGITFPPINREVLLAGFINNLGLPLEIYAATKRLADSLFMTFEWPALAPKVRCSDWPEAKLMALVVAATKLCHGLDSRQRVPHSATEPAATTLNRDAWDRFLRTGNAGRRGLLECGGSRPLLELDVGEADVFSMDGDELDRYMDWYEKMWCGGDMMQRTNLPDGILNLFPTSRAKASNGTTTPPQPQKEQEEEEASLAERICVLHGATENIQAEEKGEGLLRPGEDYLRSSVDEDTPRQLRTLIQAAADLLALERTDFETAVRAVEQALRNRVIEKRMNERKRARLTGGGDAVASRDEEAGGDDDGDDDDDDDDGESDVFFDVDGMDEDE